jgi:hypothetical protein
LRLLICGLPQPRTISVADHLGPAVGWRYLGRQAGDRNRQATVRRTGQRRGDYGPRIGAAFVHTVIDDYARVAYAEVHDDEIPLTAAGVLRRAVA